MLFATRIKSQGSQSRHAEKQQTSFQAILQQLSDYHDLKGHSLSTKRQALQVLQRLDKHPNEVTKIDLVSALAKINKASSKSTARMQMRSAFGAIFELGLIDNNPAENLPTFKKPRSSPRPLTDAEATELIHNAPEPLRSMFVLGCFAGLRAMEVAAIKGSDLSFTDGGYQLRVIGKGKTDFTIPAHPAVVEVILGADTDGQLFPGMTADSVSSKTRRYMKKIGLDKTFHSCRHYFATTALKVSGGDIMAVRDLMRHTDVATTQIYLKVADGRGAQILSMFKTPIQGGGLV
jgi:integrase